MSSTKKPAKKSPSVRFKDISPKKQVKGGLNPQPLPPQQFKAYLKIF
jgi:hypothetical protein